MAELFELTHGFLGDSGWPAYEVSNFARGPEHESRHNRKYWNHTPYLGLGPSAHSFAAGDPTADGRRAGGTSAPVRGRRWWNEPRLPGWEVHVAAGERPVAGEELLGLRELATETLMLGLRTTAGVDLDEFAARYGIDLLVENEALVQSLVRGGRLLVQAKPAGRRLVPTVRGLAVADGLAAAFELPLPD